ATTKMKKKDLGSEMNVRLVENPDVLRAIVAARKPGTVVVGFKAETGDATAEAGRMLREKKLDLVVANDVADPRSGFGSDEDRVAFVSADGVEQLPLLAKTEVARRLVEKLAERLARCAWTLSVRARNGSLRSTSRSATGRPGASARSPPCPRQSRG